MYTYSLGLYEKAFPKELPLKEKFSLAKRCGYDHMELVIDPDSDRCKRISWTKRDVREVRLQAEDADLKLTTFSLTLLRKYPFGLIDDALNEKAFDTLKKGAEIAVGLGARVMLINGYDVYYDPSTPETQARFLKNLPRVAEICTSAGLTVGIENAEMPFCYSVKQAAALAEAANSPFVGVFADMGNSANSTNGDADASMEDLETGRGRIFAMHVKDTLPGDYRFTPFGSGHVDFTKAIAKAKDLGVRVFTAELFLRPDITDPEAEATRVCKMIRSYFLNA